MVCRTREVKLPRKDRLYLQRNISSKRSILRENHILTIYISVIQRESKCNWIGKQQSRRAWKCPAIDCFRILFWDHRGHPGHIWKIMPPAGSRKRKWMSHPIGHDLLNRTNIWVNIKSNWKQLERRYVRSIGLPEKKDHQNKVKKRNYCHKVIGPSPSSKQEPIAYHVANNGPALQRCTNQSWWLGACDGKGEQLALGHTVIWVYLFHEVETSRYVISAIRLRIRKM